MPGTFESPEFVLITGATGFIGQMLCRDLIDSGFRVRAAVRHPNPDVPSAVEQCQIGNICSKTDWSEAVRDVAVVVHLVSGAAPPTRDNHSLLDRYREVNVGGTLSLARASADIGVQRLLFMSTIKVNGESTPLGKPFTENDPPTPQDEYAQSKWEAEQVLGELCSKSGPALTILRPPIVYGPRCKGNFIELMRIVSRGWPLPLASIRNLRSLVYVRNLTSAVIACLKAPQTVGKTYLISDGCDISTPDWIRAIARACGVPARLFPFPPGLLDFGASLLCKRDIAQRLTGSLQVDSSKLCADTGWQPPYNLSEGFEQTARWYHAQTLA